LIWSYDLGRLWVHVNHFCRMMAKQNCFGLSLFG
jgi:hypothetical protein